MNDFVELRRVVAMVGRRWWLLVMLPVIAAAAGFAISQRIEPVYQATTSVIVGQSIQATNLDSRDIQTSERLALSYADIARRQPILEAAVVSLDMGYTWENLRRRVKVRLVPDTQLLEISVEAVSREEAVLIADEIAHQLILLSPTSLQNQENETTKIFVQQRLGELQTKIESSQGRVNELASELAEASTRTQKSEIQAEINDLEGMILEWEDNYARFLSFAENEESSNYIAVVEEAHPKRSPVRPYKRLNTIVAGAVGLMLAIGIIFVLEFLDDTLKTVEDIDQDLNLTPLGTVELSKSRDFQEKMIVLEKPFSPMSESYRMIRTNIQFMSVDKPGKSILVTSPGPGDGKSSVALNLGIAMANNGHRTILVDTDLRKPTLHKVFNVPRDRGLTDWLRDPDIDSDLPLHETKFERLELLTAGKQPPNPSELLGSQRMGQLVTRIMGEADVVIFDSPPVAFVTDAAILSTQVDGVVVVISAGKTRRDIASRAILNLQHAGANIFGFVFNRAPGEGGRYSYYSPEDRSELTGNRAVTLLQRMREKMAFINTTGTRSG